MIYILHGDDIVASRKRIGELANNYPMTILDGKTLRVYELETNIASNGLFEEEKVVLVEGLFAKNPIKKEFLKFLNDTKVDCILIFWEDRKLSKTALSSIKNAKIEEFLLPSFYFRFLDTLSPRNKKQTFQLYHQLLNSYAPEQVFYSLFKRIRQLVVLSSGAKTEELAKISPWQLSNLERQLNLWDKESLHEFYKSLKDTEIRLKTGGLPVSLSKHLDILILSKLT